MFEKTGLSGERSELVDKANSVKAQFKDQADALNYYSKTLEKICSKNGKTIQEFLMMAETRPE